MNEEFCKARCEEYHHAEIDRKSRPRLFRVETENGKHPNGTDNHYCYGCYFPLTDLVVGDMGGRGTGEPKDVEWLS